MQELADKGRLTLGHIKNIILWSAFAIDLCLSCICLMLDRDSIMKITKFLKAELMVLSLILVFGAIGGPTNGVIRTTTNFLKRAIKLPNSYEATHELLANTYCGSNAMAGLGKLSKR